MNSSRRMASELMKPLFRLSLGWVLRYWVLSTYLSPSDSHGKALPNMASLHTPCFAGLVMNCFCLYRGSTDCFLPYGSPRVTYELVVNCPRSPRSAQSPLFITKRYWE